MARIVVTGASGFVGRHLLLGARRAGHSVVALVRSAGAAEVVRNCGAEPRIASTPAVPEAFRGSAAIVHLAQVGLERPGETFDAVNVGLTRQVIAAAQAAGVARLVFLSGLGVAHYGQVRRCTNPYFLSKLAAELELHRSGLEVAIFRPSFIAGPGDGLLASLLSQMAAGRVRRIGDGRYRMQPVAVRDAVDAILRACLGPMPWPSVVDLVGPRPVAFHDYLERLGELARELGRAGRWDVEEVPVEAAERAAAEAGTLPDLDCLLCDETADPAPLEALLGRPLSPLHAALREALLGHSVGV
jgi:NADH dehydrogenase